MAYIVNDDPTTPADTQKAFGAAAELRRLKNLLKDLYTKLSVGLNEKPDQVVNQTFTAIEGQVSVTLGFHDYSSVVVFVNGVYQIEGESYTHSGSVFQFTEALSEGDKVTIIAGMSLAVDETAVITTTTHIATNTLTNDFPLPTDTTDHAWDSALVFINGIKQSELAYVITSEGLLHFTEDVQVGDLVEASVFIPTQPELELGKAIIATRQVVSSDTTIPTGFNAFSVEPTIAEGVTVTIAPASTWAIIGDIPQ